MSELSEPSEKPSEPRGPARECDLVMKGGVTSGVVYPAALLELKDHYRFRSVGGASAGAIAASAAALAEHGRQGGIGGPRAGFDGLRLLKEELCQPGFLAQRLRPMESTERLYRALVALKAASWGSSPLSKLVTLGVTLGRFFPAKAGLGAVLGALLVMLLGGGWAGHTSMGPGWLPVAVAVVAVAVAAVSAGLGGLAGALRGLVAELAHLSGDASVGFGLCSGSGGEAVDFRDERRLELTDWLHVRFNGLVGRGPSDPPPTFAELAQAGVNLKMVACNLTLGQPYLLPMRRGSRSFVFKASELRALFPPPVVDALVAWSSANPSEWFRLPGDYHRFPFGEAMPVVVATRLSLAFPVLLSAVRLHAVKDDFYRRQGGKPAAPVLITEGDLEPHWLSDGGIASNFPVHIFDSWVPRRPTFGITLYDSPVTNVLGQRALKDFVVLPVPSDADKARPQRMEISTLFDLLRAVLDTAQSHRDNAQSALPGYRERVVQIFLEPHEGGLNLDMPPATIKTIGEKGALAGRKLIEHFVLQAGTSYDEHLWVRLQVLLARLEDELFSISEGTAGGDWRHELREQFGHITSEQLLASANAKPWYRDHSARWCESAEERFDALLELISRWKALQAAWQDGADAEHSPESTDHRAPRPTRFFARNPPLPEAMLRIHPEL